MSEWKTYKLGELCSKIGSGSTPKGGSNVYLESGEISLIRSQNVYNEGFNPNGIVYITQESANKLKNVIVNENDVLINITGDSVARVCIVDKKYLPARVNQHTAILRAIPNILDYRYLKNYLINKPIQDYLLSISSSGATRNALTKSMLENLEIQLPDIETQQKIGEFLETFNKKIQLNTQTNQTLEAIARAIFKSWFVDFDPVRAKAQAILDGKTSDEANLLAMAVISGKAIEDLSQTEYQQLWEIADAFPSELVENAEFGEVPKGWESTTLSAICSMQNGYAFKSNEWTESGIPVIKIGSVKPMIVDIESNGFVAEENEFSRSDFLLTAGDIVVGLTGYVGEVGRIPAGDKAMLNQRVAKFIPKKLDEDLSYYNFVYCLARQKTFKEYAELNAKGSAQANISTKELLNYPVCIGNEKIHLFFEKQVNSMLEQILTNSQENKVLSKTRDLLLPKLLSGEIEL